MSEKRKKKGTNEKETLHDLSISSSSQRMDYRPKTDTTQSVLFHDIEKYNQYLEHREFRKQYIQKPSEQLISASPHMLKQIIQKEKEEEAVNCEHALNNSQVVGIMMGNQIDKMQIKKIYQHNLLMNNELNTWERFANQLSDEKDSIFLNPTKHTNDTFCGTFHNKKEFLFIDQKK